MSDPNPSNQAIFQVWQQTGSYPGFWLPATNFQAADQSFQGAALYGASTGATVYLVAQTPPVATVGYVKRRPGDESRLVNLWYQIEGKNPGFQGSTFPSLTQGKIGDLYSLVQQIKNDAGMGRKYLIRGLDAQDNSWVYYYDSSRQP